MEMRLREHKSKDVCENDAGHVFAIPDLWKPSTCLLRDDFFEDASFLFSQLTLDGILRLLRCFSQLYA